MSCLVESISGIRYEEESYPPAVQGQEPAGSQGDKQTFASVLDNFINTKRVLLFY